MEKVPSLMGIGVVAAEELSRKNAELERKFFNKPFEIFETVEAAFHWAQDQIPT